METWLPLTDYSSKYKISVSTLRRRIKADDIKYHFQDGKYYIFDEQPTRSEQFKTESIKNSIKSSPSLNSLDSDLIFDDEILSDLDMGSEAIEVDKAYSQRPPAVGIVHAYNPDFLENLKKSANAKLPQVKSQQGVLSQQQAIRTAPAINIEEEYFFKKEKPAATEPEEITESESQTVRDFSDKISKIGINEPVLTAANKLLNELKKAYTQILQEKEEQMMILKEEVSDLKTLVKALERENEKLKNQNW
ncbi:MAG: hypothetical protein JNL11_12545 [Bdellovibrionaceae bacterium]|nr:hypothetical protein [Pseudobdellovibrionaceae bacterium]